LNNDIGMDNEITKTAKKIKKLMIDKDVRGADIARRIEVSKVMVTLTIAGKRKAYRVRKAIADALDVGVPDLWPDETCRPSVTRKTR
jgi:hypothetical protein